jgi:hypothetical protein
MLIALWTLLSVSLARPCLLDVPPDTPFDLAAPSAEARIHPVLELWPNADQLAWTDQMLSALEARGQQGTVMLPLPEAEATDPALLALAERALQGEHEVGVVFRERDVPRDSEASPAPMKRRLKSLRKAAGGVKVAAAPLPSRSSEALLGRMGFRTLLQVRGPATAIPRLAVVMEGQPRIGVVLHSGPYAGPCGVKPDIRGLTPASADRITQALWGAARVDGVPVVRVAIHGSDDGATEALLLGRWLDEVLAPAQTEVYTANQARVAVLAYFRTGRVMRSSPLEAGGGRLVHLKEVRAAADALADENLLPRRLPGDLNLTEAFLSFALLLAGQNEGEVVRLAALTGPQTHAVSRVDGITEVECSAVQHIAKALLNELPGSVPAVLPVGDRSLSAPELLTAFASAIRGDKLCRTWPTASPEPNAPGLGWGESTLP